MFLQENPSLSRGGGGSSHPEERAYSENTQTRKEAS